MYPRTVLLVEYHSNPLFSQVSDLCLYFLWNMTLTLSIHCFRLLLLVEDSQGTVAIISGADHVSDVEGCVCCFSSLRVQGRTNADRSVAWQVTWILVKHYKSMLCHLLYIALSPAFSFGHTHTYTHTYTHTHTHTHTHNLSTPCLILPFSLPVAPPASPHPIWLIIDENVSSLWKKKKPHWLCWLFQRSSIVQHYSWGMVW